MYNGIGLRTPRGSGTAGYVQASKFLAKPRPSPSSCSPSAAGGMRKPNRDIVEHERKRQVELRLLVLREALEEQGYTEAEIEARVDEARKAAEAETASALGSGGGGRRQTASPAQRVWRLTSSCFSFSLMCLPVVFFYSYYLDSCAIA